MFRNANFSNLVWGVIARHVRLVSWWTLIYACRHAETIKKQYDRQASSFSSSQPSFIVLYAPVCLSSTLWNIKKITWAQHCSKWQANALGISKKTLRVSTYIYRRRSRLQTTIYSFSVFDSFFFFLSSLSLHAIWEVWITKVPEQIACILACIAVFLFTSYLQTRTKKRRINRTFPFMSFISISWMGNRKRSHIDLQSVEDMHIK